MFFAAENELILTNRVCGMTVAQITSAVLDKTRTVAVPEQTSCHNWKDQMAPGCGIRRYHSAVRGSSVDFPAATTWTLCNRNSIAADYSDVIESQPPTIPSLRWRLILYEVAIGISAD